MRTAEWAMRLKGLEGLKPLFEISGPTVWQSVSVESRPVLFAAAWRAKPRKTLIVAGNYERALAWQADQALGRQIAEIRAWAVGSR